MSKQRASKLDPHAERLEEWFGAGVTLEEAQRRLRELGCVVSRSRLGDWWQGRMQARQQEALLRQIATGARQHQEVLSEFARHPAPELETIIALHRVLILKLSTQANTDPDLLDLIGRLMKPVLEHAKLVEKRRELELAEQKYRDQVAERVKAIQAELGRARESGGVREETIEKIERELKLL